MKSRSRALTLPELLVAILIISLLAALVAPIYGRSKEAGKRGVCITRLRQFGTALSLYADAYGDYPKDPSLLSHSEQLPAVLLACPSDPFDGFASVAWQCRGRKSLLPFSYETMLDWHDELRSDLLAADANHGVLACRLHGVRESARAREVCLDLPFMFHGTLLRLRRDSSVQTARYVVQSVEWPLGSGRYYPGASPWDLFTDEPRPKRFPF